MFSILIKLLLFILVDNNDDVTGRVIGGVFGAVAGVLFLVATVAVLIICCIRVLLFKVCFPHSLPLVQNTNIPTLIPNYQL